MGCRRLLPVTPHSSPVPATGTCPLGSETKSPVASMHRNCPTRSLVTVGGHSHLRRSRRAIACATCHPAIAAPRANLVRQLDEVGGDRILGQGNDRSPLCMGGSAHRPPSRIRSRPDVEAKRRSPYLGEGPAIPSADKDRGDRSRRRRCSTSTCDVTIAEGGCLG